MKGNTTDMFKLSRRAVSVLCSCALFTVMFLTVLTGTVIFSDARNLSAVGQLNREEPVQMINLMPVEVVENGIDYSTENGSIVEDADSRTTFKIPSGSTTDTAFSNQYLNVVRNKDESITYSIKKKMAANANDTTYMWTETEVGQKINLAENPYFMLGFESYSCRANGRLILTVTKNGTTYYFNTSSKNIGEYSSTSNLAYSGFDFYCITSNKYTTDSNVDKNDYAYSAMKDYTIDFYAYLYKYFEQNNWITNYWPEFGKDGNYITVTSVRHTIVSEKKNTPLNEGVRIKWKYCALGREALNNEDTLTPREEEVVTTDSNGRCARLDDGVMVFRNTSSTQNAVFKWDVQRYFNVVELEALELDVEYINSTQPFGMRFAIMGYSWINSDHKYSSQGFWVSLDDMIANYSDRKDVAVPAVYDQLKVDFASCIKYWSKKSSSAGDNYYPDDNLLRIREVELTLPPNSKLSFNYMNVSVKNEYAGATNENTVYPWSVTDKPESLPPSGTPATTEKLDLSTGNYASAYNWMATSVPTVQSKVDLLALTDQHVLYEDGMYDTTESDGVTDFWRTLDGSSYFTSNSEEMVYRSFKRRGSYTVGEINNGSNNNYYMYVNINTTPFLYFSYEMSGGDDASAGLYFKFADKGIVTNADGATSQYSQFYLGQSGLALKPCDGIMSSTNETAGEAHKALCSSATARTGVIDLRQYFRSKDANGNYTVVMNQVRFEELRFYLTGTTTKVHFNYLFFGSETLADTAKTTIAKNSGDAFPWAVSHDTFKNATLGTNSSFTFANRVDLLWDMDDRADWNVKNSASKKGNTVDEWYGGSTRYQKHDDGALTVKVGKNEDYAQVGHSFDHVMKINIGTDNTKLRYINYSVEASQGMRWSIIVREDPQNGNDAGSIIRTWTDAVVLQDYNNSNKDIVDKSETYGQSYFRDMQSSTVFDKFWFTGDGQSIENARDDAWAVFSVPGSETGCFDLSKVSRDIYTNSNLHMNFDKVLSFYLVAYKDPSIKDVTGNNDVAGSVKFNYVYLTSEPLTGSSFGAPAVKDNTSYSWPLTGATVSFNMGKYGKEFHTRDKEYVTTWCTDYYMDAAKSTVKFNPDDSGVANNYYSSYNLFYSFTFKLKGTNTVAYAPYAILFKESGGGYYVSRLRSYGSEVALASADVGAYTATNKNCRFEDLTGNYRLQMPDTGVISLAKLKAAGMKNMQSVRVFYDATKYDLNIEYCVIALNQTYGAASGSKSITKLPSSEKKADFSKHAYVQNPGITSVLQGDQSGNPYTTVTGNEDYGKNITVNLNETPYLYYSVEYFGGATGTFALRTTTTANGSKGFYRDGSVSDVNSPNLIAAGTSPSTTKYMLTSETGCINVKKWYEKYDALPSNGKITIDHIYMYLLIPDGKTSATAFARYHYLYFAGIADKTLDLIPEVASGNLDSGVSTHAWSFDDDLTGGEVHPATSASAEWDIYKGKYYQNGDEVSTEPTLDVKYPGDTNKDNFNDLRYSDTRWGFHSICYGEIEESLGKSYEYVSTGNNQMSGLTINLNETPYLHFSISQAEGSYTTFLLQTNDFTSRQTVRNESADKVKPWLSCYIPDSPAGQLMIISTQSQYMTFYKDSCTEELKNDMYTTGEIAGVIDLRSWFTETNGYSNIISLERVRFYTTNYDGTGRENINNWKGKSDVTVNHFYLSSSCGSAYSVTFDNNIPDDTTTSENEHKTVAVQVLKNANNQYVSDSVAENFKKRDGYTFVGWYTDKEWENYFDIKKTPITENITLYAGWIDNKDVVQNECDFLGEATSSADGVVKVESDALAINNTTDKAYTVTIPVNKAYSVSQLPSLYIGFDTNKTCTDAKIAVDMKSLGTHQFDLLGDAFGTHFSTDGVLTASPYDKEVSMFTRLATDDLLPVDESLPNTPAYLKDLVYVKSVTVTVPAGVSMHLRYFIASKSMSQSLLTSKIVAPQITGTVLDILDPGEGDDYDPGFVEQLRGVTYEMPEEKTEIYGRDIGLRQAHISGVDGGYATFGSLYGLGDMLGDVPISSSNKQYLYFHVSQSENSKTTFNIWAGIYYRYTTTANGTDYKTASYYPNKWSTFYNHSTKSLGSQADMVNGSIPDEAFASGSFSGAINVYDWYSTALDGISIQGQYNIQVTGIHIHGVRLYGVNSGTDATFNYMAFGGAASNSSTKASVVYPTSSSATASKQISDVTMGQGVNIALDDLTECPNASDPSVKFEGWTFTSGGTAVWWNPTPTNYKKYSSSNTGGAWSTSKVTGFVQNRADVTYQLTTETAKIYPVFGGAYKPSLTVNFSGSGTVSVVDNDAGTTTSATATKTISYDFGKEIVLSTSASNFAGWYENGQLVSTSNEYRVTMIDNTAVTAKFGTAAATVIPQAWAEEDAAIVWLQKEEGSSLVAGTDFYLESVNNANAKIDMMSETNSLVNSVDAGNDIVCYWHIHGGQMVKAKAPTGYHFEQYLSDGSTVRVSESNVHTFIATSNFKLIVVKDTGDAFKTSIAATEYAVNFDRYIPITNGNVVTEKPSTAHVTAQVSLAQGETLVSAGIVIAQRPSGVITPSYRSGESTTVSASAWNSTTGQFIVETEYPVDYRAQFVRAYAIVRTANGKYAIRYSDFVTKSF